MPPDATVLTRRSRSTATDNDPEESLRDTAPAATISGVDEHGRKVSFQEEEDTSYGHSSAMRTPSRSIRPSGGYLAVPQDSQPHFSNSPDSTQSVFGDEGMTPPARPRPRPNLPPDSLGDNSGRSRTSLIGSIASLFGGKNRDSTASMETSEYGDPLSSPDWSAPTSPTSGSASRWEAKGKGRESYRLSKVSYAGEPLVDTAVYEEALLGGGSRSHTPSREGRQETSGETEAAVTGSGETFGQHGEQEIPLAPPLLPFRDRVGSSGSRSIGEFGEISRTSSRLSADLLREPDHRTKKVRVYLASSTDALNNAVSHSLPCMSAARHTLLHVHQAMQQLLKAQIRRLPAMRGPMLPGRAAN